MAVFAITDETVEVTEQYAIDQGLEFPILAEAPLTREAWGIDMIWGNVVHLVDPEGRIVADGLGRAEDVLSGRDRETDPGETKPDS